MWCSQVSLTDGKCFVRAAREVADAQQTDSFSRPSDEKLQAGRRLLSFLVTRHKVNSAVCLCTWVTMPSTEMMTCCGIKELHWSNAEWDEIAYVQWVAHTLRSNAFCVQYLVLTSVSPRPGSCTRLE